MLYYRSLHFIPRQIYIELYLLWFTLNNLVMKGRVCNATVRFVLLYWFETWPLREDVHHLEVFDHRFVRHLAKVGWSDRVNNLEVRRCVLRRNGSDTPFQKIKLCRLRWLCSPTTSSPIFSSAGKVEETSRRPTNDATAWDEQCFSWFEQTGLVTLTWLESKRFLN